MLFQKKYAGVGTGSNPTVISKTWFAGVSYCVWKGRVILFSPPRKTTPTNRFLRRKAPEPVMIDQTPLTGPNKALSPIIFKQVRRTPSEKLFNALMAQYHYLGYTQPVGEHLKYLAFSGDRPIACLAFSSAAYHLGCRDRYIGWRPETRKKNLHLLAYNLRFLILPWVKSPFLASHLLSKCARDVHRIGRVSTSILFIGWRPLSIQSDLKALVTELPIGPCWEKQQVEGKTTQHARSFAPSNTYMATPLCATSEANWRLCDESRTGTSSVSHRSRSCGHDTVRVTRPNRFPGK